MPVYKFDCEQCHKVHVVFSNMVENEHDCPDCGLPCTKIYSNTAEAVVTEKVGKYWDKNLKVGVKEELQKKNTEHMREYEMDEIIAKYGMDVMKNHPLIKDGRIKKKGES